jgi:hypothetical protein
MELPVGPMANLSVMIAEYFGLIECTGTFVQRMLHESFNSGKRMLRDAERASGENQISLIRSARDKFYAAENNERNEAQMLAIVGLSMCHKLLGDDSLAYSTLNRIDDVTLTRAEKVKCYAHEAMGVIPSAYISLLYSISTGRIDPYVNIGVRTEIFEAFQTKCKEVNFRLLE